MQRSRLNRFASARAQGGRIRAAPREDGGSEFGFSLPLAADPVDAST